MEDQIGYRALERRLLAEAASLVQVLPELPRLLHQKLSAPAPATEAALREVATAQQSRNRWLAVIALLLAVIIVLMLRTG
jgi:ubiquinone biosynthesis protein